MQYYVNAAASRDGNGSREMPFRRIGDAAKIARPGDEVIVAPGVYREYVNPRNAGTEDKRIVYRSEKIRGAVITGAEILTGWKLYEGNVWVNRVGNGVFGAYNPYTTFVCGDWYFAPTVRHTGAVFFDDRMLYETVTLEELAFSKLISLKNDPYSNEITGELLSMKKIHFPDVIYSDNIETVPQTVRRTGGIHLTGESCKKQNASGICYKDVAGPGTRSSFCLAALPTNDNPLINILFREAEEFYKAAALFHTLEIPHTLY